MTIFGPPEIGLRGCFLGIWGPKWGPKWVILGSQTPLGPPWDPKMGPFLDTPISGVLIFMWELDMKWGPGTPKGVQNGVPK